MSEDLVRPLEVGDGTPEDLLAGVARTTEDLVGAANALGRVLEEVLQRLENVESDTDPAQDVDLEEWVGWLRRAYHLSAPIPADWRDVAGVQQELQALHAAWCAAYKKDGTPIAGTAAVAWHDSLDRALERMRRHTARDEDKSGVERPPWAGSSSAEPGD
ncbi:hypothetical protein ACHAAC_17025 [Aeromicrobium sp. CF4.19]|uniref:hypothetical protein n=1 Tax=Aeromicrobium sp. CF4.19 TaxID=3373082 RepID=UPI003EE5EF5B